MKERVVLRPWTMADAPMLQIYANNPQIAANLRDGFPHPYNLEDAKAFIAAAAQGKDQYIAAIEVDGKAVGSIGIFLKGDIYRKSVEIGYWLAEPFWGQGIMSEAVRQIVAYAFAHYDIVRVYAEPFAHNAASRRVLEKSGFVLEGILQKNAIKNGQLIDSCIYGLVRLPEGCAE